MVRKWFVDKPKINTEYKKRSTAWQNVSGRSASLKMGGANRGEIDGVWGTVYTVWEKVK